MADDIIALLFSTVRPPVEPVFQRAPSQSIDLPFDILDHIFSLLKFHREALLACSKAHPVLSQIVERYRFRHIITNAGLGSKFADSLDLRKHLDETPRIAKHVTVLQIDFYFPHHPPESTCGMSSIFQELAPKLLTAYWEDLAALLPMFPVLECLMLPTLNSALRNSILPQSFKTALENCLHLPTLHEVHVGDMSFPLSMLDNHANINYLALSGPPEIEREFLETTYPQIKTLALGGFECRHTVAFRTWARHIVGLQSLKYDFSCHQIIVDVLRICSNTLQNLHLCLQRQGTQDFHTINLSSLPHLRHLTIHAEIFVLHEDKIPWNSDMRTYLPSAVEILETASSLHQLTIEIYVDPSGLDLPRVSLSPLRALTKSSVCIPHIELYIYTGSPLHPVTRTLLGSWLAKHDGLMKLIEQGVLAVHPEETAPTLSRSYVATENNKESLAHLAGPLRAILDI